jgi:microcystin degradation protein MlrC
MTRRVLIAQVMHETNTFSRLPTDLDDYRRRYLHEGDAVLAAFRGTRTEIGGLIDSADSFGWTLVHPLAASATPSGKVTADCWKYLKGRVIEGARAAGEVDGAVLALHGAMVTEDEDDAEGALLAALREVVGPDIPIAITLDLHANVSDAMAHHANAIIAYRTYPHIDQHERACQAAGLIDRAMRREIRPVCRVARRPALDGCDAGRTQGLPPNSPMNALLTWADGLERDPDVLAVSVHAGFGWADIADAGPSVAVTTDGDATRARAIAEDMMNEVWRRRAETTADIVSLDDAMAEVRTTAGEGRPLVLADTTDNPGGGGYGDATGLLRAMIEAKLTSACFAPISDGAAVEAGMRAGKGATVSLDLGGRIDPAFGAPLRVTGTVMHLSDGAMVNDGPMYAGVRFSMGPTMVLRVGGIDIVVTTNRQQVTDLQAFLSQGIDPRQRDVVALKSSQHFRAAYQPIARRVMIVDSGALCSPDYKRFTYHKLRRPIWPLDEVA